MAKILFNLKDLAPGHDLGPATHLLITDQPVSAELPLEALVHVPFEGHVGVALVGNPNTPTVGNADIGLTVKPDQADVRKR